MKWFKNPTTLEELKAEYKKLAFAHHPDMGGSTEEMQQINAEYEILCKKLATVHKNAQGEYYHTDEDKAEGFEEFIDLMDKLIRMKGVIVELCGSWLWITGETKKYKEDLKAMGFRWSQNKEAWYFHHGEYRKYGKQKTLNEIRSMFGSTAYVPKEDREIVPA